MKKLYLTNEEKVRGFFPTQSERRRGKILHFLEVENAYFFPTVIEFTVGMKKFTLPLVEVLLFVEDLD